MARIRGAGLGAGMALGTAAVIREHNGVPIPPRMPERIALAIASRRAMETPEVILVARDYNVALALLPMIDWARVTGIAAENAQDNAPVSSFPAVIGLPNLLKQVQDDVLILLDAGNSFVFPDPDPMFLAQYTAEHDRIAPRRRIYLDEGHTQAHTTDGTAVQVFARTETLSDVAMAISQGADGLYLPTNSDVQKVTLQAQQKLLFQVIHTAAGKPLILGDRYSLPPMLLVEAAVEADLTIAVPSSDAMPGMGLTELGRALDRVENSCFDDDVPASIPRIALLVPSVSDPSMTAEECAEWIDRSASSGASRIIFSLDEEPLGEGVLFELEHRLAAAARNLLPTYVSCCEYSFNAFGMNDLENTFEEALTLLVGAGVTGVLVLPDAVHQAKNFVGELNSSDCRERYRSVIEGISDN